MTVNRKSFTLIELVIVIALCGVLLAISIATFRSARTKARDVNRKQNMQSYSLAISMYKKDFGHYPNDSSNNYAFCSTRDGTGGDSDYRTYYTNWTTLASNISPYISPMPTDPKSSCRGTFVTRTQYIQNGYWPEYTYYVKSTSRFIFAANLEYANDSEKGGNGTFDNLYNGKPWSTSNPNIYAIGCRLSDPNDQTSTCY